MTDDTRDPEPKRILDELVTGGRNASRRERLGRNEARIATAPASAQTARTTDPGHGSLGRLARSGDRGHEDGRADGMAALRRGADVAAAGIRKQRAIVRVVAGVAGGTLGAPCLTGKRSTAGAAATGAVHDRGRRGIGTHRR